MDQELEKRVYHAIERWTVFRLMEPHFDTASLENLKKALLMRLKKHLKRPLKDKALVLYQLSSDILYLLEGLNVDTDQGTCDRMASILCDVYLELEFGGHELYQQLLVARTEKCESESIE